MSKVNSELAAAIAAASLAEGGPDIDGALEEIVAAAGSSVPVDIEALVPERPIGMGGQGGVWLAYDPTSGVKCAVKQIRKGRLSALPKKAATRALVEREALLEVGHHPFITTLHAAFQNDTSSSLRSSSHPVATSSGSSTCTRTAYPRRRRASTVRAWRWLCAMCTLTGGFIAT